MEKKYALQLLHKDESSALCELGGFVHFQYGPQCWLNDEDIGRLVWQNIESDLYSLLCDSRAKKPKQWVEDLVTGDVRNLLVGIIGAIATTYSIGLGIAVPAAALVVKRGIVSFCRREVAKRRPRNLTKVLQKTLWQYLEPDIVARGRIRRARRSDGEKSPPSTKPKSSQKN